MLFKMSKYTKKIENLKKKRYNYDPEEKLEKTLGFAGGEVEFLIQKKK